MSAIAESINLTWAISLETSIARDCFWGAAIAFTLIRDSFPGARQGDL